MSTHDRGAFGALLAEAKTLGCGDLEFRVDLLKAGEDESRWSVEGYPPPDDDGGGSDVPIVERSTGRTGEEALRRLVESLRSRV